MFETFLFTLRAYTERSRSLDQWRHNGTAWKNLVRDAHTTQPPYTMVILCHIQVWLCGRSHGWECMVSLTIPFVFDCHEVMQTTGEPGRRTSIPADVRIKQVFNGIPLVVKWNILLLLQRNASEFVVVRGCRLQRWMMMPSLALVLKFFTHPKILVSSSPTQKY